MPEFRWNTWNLHHIAGHGIKPLDAEYVASHATSPYPAYQGDGKWGVRGKTEAGAFIQVIYIIDPVDTWYIIHARPLGDKEKRNLRRRKR